MTKIEISNFIRGKRSLVRKDKRVFKYETKKKKRTNELKAKKIFRNSVDYIWHKTRAFFPIEISQYAFKRIDRRRMKKIKSSM